MHFGVIIRLAAVFLSPGLAVLARASSGGAGLPTAAMQWVGDVRLLPEFPKPDPSGAFADLKIRQPDGAFIRLPREDWAAARVRVADDPAWREWLSKRQAVTDAWIRKNRDRVEWRAGWSHDFVSPKDGSFLVWTEDIPGEQTHTLRSRSGHEVELTPKIFGGWVMKFREQHLYQITEAARLYRITGDTRYRDWAAGQLDFYAENLQRWPVVNPKGNYARLGCQSLEDAVWLARFVDAVRLLRDEVEPERLKAWCDNLLKPQAGLLDRSFQVIHNIAVWHRASQASVALLTGDEAMWSRVVDGPFGLRAQLRRGVTSDYLWYEQSMGYNDYIVAATYPLFLVAGLLGHGDRLKHEAAVVQNLMLAPLMIRFPHGTLPNPADTTRIPVAPSGWLARGYRVFPTSVGLVRASGNRSWDTLVDPPAEVASGAGTAPDAMTEALPEVRSVSMESSRFALLRSGPWQVFLHYGQINRSHSQAEALNWSASFDGTDVTHDPGTVGYGSPMSNGYYRRGLNHNVPLVDGEGQVPWRRGELLLFDAGRAIVSAAQPDYRPDASARRTLRIEGNKLIDEVSIATRAAEGQTPPAMLLGLALHLQGTPLLDSRFQPDPAFAQGRPEPFGYWRDVRRALFEDEAVIDVRFSPVLTLRVRIATPGRFAIWQGKSPDYPPGQRSGFYVEKGETGVEATFTTEIFPLR
ncbi:heparinase [Opitutaceae bacterium TAV5]|nr:heparinase [Opitutaceae bacterium TAV5]